MQKKVSGVTCLRVWRAAGCAAFLLSVVVGAQAEQHPMLTTHVPEAVSSGVAPLVGPVPGKQPLSLAISLPLRNEVELDALLREIYDPQNPKFHKYLSVGETWTSRQRLSCGHKFFEGERVAFSRRAGQPAGDRR